MKGQDLPTPDHIARHCEKRFFFDGVSIGPGNFQLRADEDYLSVDWLEMYAAGTIEGNLEALRRRYKERRFRTIGNKDKIGVLNVGAILDLVQRKSVPAGKKLRILHEPVETRGKENDAHAGIFDMRNGNRVDVLLAQAAIAYPGKAP